MCYNRACCCRYPADSVRFNESSRRQQLAPNVITTACMGLTKQMFYPAEDGTTYEMSLDFEAWPTQNETGWGLFSLNCLLIRVWSYLFTHFRLFQPTHEYGTFQALVSHQKSNQQTTSTTAVWMRARRWRVHLSEVKMVDTWSTTLTLTSSFQITWLVPSVCYYIRAWFFFSKKFSLMLLLYSIIQHYFRWNIQPPYPSWVMSYEWSRSRVGGLAHNTFVWNASTLLQRYLFTRRTRRNTAKHGETRRKR